jgi:hypothetical protein
MRSESRTRKSRCAQRPEASERRSAPNHYAYRDYSSLLNARRYRNGARNTQKLDATRNRPIERAAGISSESERGTQHTERPVAVSGETFSAQRCLTNASMSAALRAVVLKVMP